MRSKLRAALLAPTAGEAVIMANGSEDGILDRIFAAEPVGTLFLPHGEDVPAWKRWVGYTARPQGKLIVDDGARRAVVSTAGLASTPGRPLGAAPTHPNRVP